jgi:TonB family protein
MLQEIANHLWQSTVFIIGIAVLCLLLRQDAARIRYWLWWTGSVKFLVPFALLTSVGAWLSDRATVTIAPAWTTTFSAVARPFATESEAWTLGTVLLTLWVTGTLVVLGSWIVRAGRLRQILRLASPDAPIPLDGRRMIRVYRTRACVEPGVVGLLRPALLLPADLDDRLRPSQFEVVLAHELCHIRRHDNLTAAVHMLVEAVFWFHPLVWWLGGRLIDERERACDEMVVALGHDRETYAASILDVCEHYAATRLACASGISGSDLKRRIVQIMGCAGVRRLKRVKKLVLSLAYVAVLVLPILGGLAIDRVAEAQQTAPNSPIPAEYLPTVAVPPVYPPLAAERGLEGYVVVQYTVTETGSTADVRVLDSSDPLFNASAIESVQKYRYPPRVIDGTPVQVAGVKSRIEYVFPDEEDTPPPAVAAVQAERGDYKPSEVVAPVYPPRAVASGLEGYVIVQFTITTTGSTRDVAVVESSSALFDRPALEAVARFRYEPTTVDGRPVEVQGVRTRINFELDD